MSKYYLLKTQDEHVSRIQLFIIILITILLAESTFGIRAGRVGGARGGFKSGQSRRDRQRNKTLMAHATAEKKADEIIENLYFDMTSGNWTEMENRTWIYASALIDLNEVYQNDCTAVFGPPLSISIVLVVIIELFYHLFA